MDNPIKYAGDVAAASVTVATIVGWLPAIAALLTIIYTAFRIYDWIEQRMDKQDVERDRSNS